MKRFTLLVILSLVAGAMFAQNLTCYDVQYTANPDGVSPYFGQNVVVEGIVSAVLWKGYASFFISDPAGGAWSGVFIYDLENEYGYDLALGDMVEVHGLVDEYYDMTEIKDLTDVVVVSSGNPVPDPCDITTYQLSTQEDYEGVLVRVNNVTVTQDLDDHNQWFVDDYAYRTEAQIDDGFFYLDEVMPPIIITIGDTYDYLIGLVDYSYDEFGLNPRTPQDMGIGVSVDEETIAALAVLSNYPNPFNPETTIVFSMVEPATADLAIYNVRGQRVRHFGAQSYDSGEHRITWNGADDSGRPVASGVYFFKIGSGRYTATKKMILLK
ncbi:MAG: T9SS type A sorting domain-containing protein [Candidatus Cloacimonetes bacterium]|nr:T9SS type A sorting domain-containing protein [Candidatus Cloacimonadota bacterium]